MKPEGRSRGFRQKQRLNSLKSTGTRHGWHCSATARRAHVAGYTLPHEVLTGAPAATRQLRDAITANSTLTHYPTACSASRKACHATRCCASLGERCFSKTVSWAQCLLLCDGKVDRDGVRWLCTELHHASAKPGTPLRLSYAQTARMLVACTSRCLARLGLLEHRETEIKSSLLVEWLKTFPCGVLASCS